MIKTKLFCIPYSGSSATLYSRWKSCLHESIELCQVEFPGRGQKFSDPLCNSAGELINYLYDQIENQIYSSPYVLFGHCYGALLAYELGHKITELKQCSPQHIFFSGRQVPHIGYESTMRGMTEEKLIAEVMTLEGTLKEIFEDEELTKVYLPILRADLKLAEECQFVAKNDKLDCNITVFVGNQDQYVSDLDIVEWPSYTKKQCAFYKFQGGHFFLHNHMEEIVGIINNTILKNAYCT
ncbi:surfactin synthase thioesterase subunit [Anaerobacterium chartisolvens]|uniref:Surfactin synthase thioesterase subunit n=1 Tax=Anaerobacterium chartisolvens TaxID=1297424 RepID=A0A369B502_9FIRM|nr:thioesterase domain-containing protein [Anaerobacterium chartisolvens]RCX16511.1 surfactin synthase thioesterase subunit [Anaerobacterium chartisolvens]